MADLDFPDTPANGDSFFSGDKTFVFFSPAWEIVKTQVATAGILDGGDAGGGEISISGGVSKSNFTGLTAIDCGAA